VVNEYIRRGYEAAGNHNRNNNGRNHMDDKRTNYGGQNGWQNPWGSMPPFTEQWLMAMRAWTEAWSAFIPGGAPQQAWRTAGNGRTNSEVSPTVSMQLWSERPAELITSLRLGTDFVDLELDPLYREGGTAQLVNDISITRVPGRVRVSVKIRPDQPAGRYYGAIRNVADRSIVGDLTVMITDPSRPQM
jgi:hypothetical protein